MANELKGYLKVTEEISSKKIAKMLGSWVLNLTLWPSEFELRDLQNKLKS